MIKPFYEGKDQLIRDEGMRSSAFAGMTLMLAAEDLDYELVPDDCTHSSATESDLEAEELPRCLGVTFKLPFWVSIFGSNFHCILHLGSPFG